MTRFDDDDLEEITAKLNELRDGGIVGFSDDALALRFTEKHGDELRYVAEWGRWYRWTGTHWGPESTLLAYDLARNLLRAAAQSANSGGKSIASSSTVNAVVSLARTDRRHAATVDQWDRNAWLLNTPEGTINLKTGAVQPHASADFITKVTAAAPVQAPCPIWKSFLTTVTDGDIQLEAFLQRVAGYCLTGSTREHAMFFLYGLGGNGKTVFINTLTGILTEYHRVAPMEMLLASKQDRHPTELAGLMGQRLVTAIETEAGRRWAEAKIKALTGGDPIPARFMRGDFFEYVPAFKLLIAGNHKPSLNRVDEAVRRRFHLVPFTVTIPPAQRDLELVEKLKAEWSAILQWAIDGCLEWQEHGLMPPASVTAATNDYFASQDTIRNWLNECAVEDVNSEVLCSVLFASWKQWCIENNEYAGSLKSFGQRLQDMGVPGRHSKKGELYRGYRLTG
jgi:P4 family phage/plasmid primase-like protien